MHRFKIFTLQEANRILKLVTDLTASTQKDLDVLRSAAREQPDDRADIERRTREMLDEWARLILELGAQPKGVFTVDFRSPDPNVLWCWAPDEREVCHRHFTWETFKDRVPIVDDRASWPALN